MNDLVNSMAQTILQLEEENVKLKERLEQFEAAYKDTEPTMNNELTPHIEYYSNGNVWIKGQKNSGGQGEGLWEWFYENGNIYRRAPYKEGKEDGIAEVFYENGNIEWRTTYKEGKEDGIEEWFYENGNIRRRTPYKGDEKDGIEEWFDEQGNITKTRLWKDGELIEETEN